MIVFLNLKGKQNVEGEKEGVHTVSNISQSKHIHIIFFHPNCSFLFIQLYPFLIEKLKTH